MAWKRSTRRPSGSRISPAAARTSPAGCTTRCSPAGCGPLADGVRGFPRLVRDVARQLGKKVRFEVVGETTGVDRDILEKLEAPLNHLIRNALDHGHRAARAARGGRQDRGRGRSGWRRATARGCSRSPSPTTAGGSTRAAAGQGRRAGAGRAAMAEQLTEAELLEFLFLPGFSTKEAVTEISGRGVGLDVVQSMVQAVGGIGARQRRSSARGRGSPPAADHDVGHPGPSGPDRRRAVRLPAEPDRPDPDARSDAIRLLEGRQHFVMDDQPVGLVEAAQVLELPPSDVASATSFRWWSSATASHRFGVVVDEFLGERDLEVRPLDPRLGKVPDINSASVLEDGWPVLIIDVEDLVRSIDNLLGGRRLRRVGTVTSGAAAARPPERVLVVDDSITVRELERQLLESRGYAVDVAVDGVDGWNAVRGGAVQLVISDVDMPRMDGIELVRIDQGRPAGCSRCPS